MRAERERHFFTTLKWNGNRILCRREMEVVRKFYMELDSPNWKGFRFDSSQEQLIPPPIATSEGRYTIRTLVILAFELKRWMLNNTHFSLQFAKDGGVRNEFLGKIPWFVFCCFLHLSHSLFIPLISCDTAEKRCLLIVYSQNSK